jgi:outer membrane protein assembly complex protein YaeT
MGHGVSARAIGAVLPWLLVAAPVRADVAEHLGRPVSRVRVESEGRSIADANTLSMLETRAGRPLAMNEVRATVLHLFSLGRYEHVVVRAAPTTAGVELVYDLVPSHPVTGLSFVGLAGIGGVDADRLRRMLFERFGTDASPARAPDMAGLVTAELAAAGYRRAAVVPRVDLQHDPERSHVAFTVTPGIRTRVKAVEPLGRTAVPDDLVRRLGITPGSPYVRDAIAGRITAYVEELRRSGHYDALLAVAPRFDEAEQTATIAVRFEAGPRVRLQFRGDPLDADRRAELVPIAREGSADEDLLEDSAQRIVEYLRDRGYRDAAATYTRERTGDELVITFVVKRGALYRVGRVDIVGRRALSEVDFRALFRIEEGQPFAAGALDAAISAIESVYARRGYLQARVQATVQPIPGEAPPGGSAVPLAIRLEIAENVQTEVASVRIEGNEALGAGTLLPRLGLQPRQPFFQTQLALDRDTIELQYLNAGYRQAAVSSHPTISADGTRADVVFRVAEGPQIRVEHVLIVGNERTRPEVIRRELQLGPGDPLGIGGVTESQRRLATLGLFRRTRITEVGHGLPTRRDLLVSVEEAPATSIGYGGGFEVIQRIRRSQEQGGLADERFEFAPRAFFEVGRRNFFGKNRSVNLFTRLSLRPRDPEFLGVQATPIQTATSAFGFSEYRVLGTYREPRVMDTAFDAFLTATTEQQRRSSFNFARRAFSADLLRRLSRAVSLSGNYQIQRTELFDEQINPADKLLVDRLFPQVRLSSFSLSAIGDTRDDLLDPQRGLYLSANSQFAARRIGSEVGLLKSYLTAQLFRPIPQVRGVVLATSARIGLASGFPREVAQVGPDGQPVVDPAGQPIVEVVRDLPASERFFAGGDTTVRAFARDQLGTPATLDQDGLPIGGNALVILNAELRMPVRGGLGVVAFFDSGNVFTRTQAIDLGALRSAVGFGVRYRSPVGPIRVDLGFKTNRREIRPGSREDLTALHISLGQAF